MTTARDTLRLPQRGTVRVPANERTREFNRRPATRKEGHDALIQALAPKGVFIRIRLLATDEELYGKLKESDRFTITIFEESVPGEFTIQRIIFKHAIESFVIVNFNSSFNSSQNEAVNNDGDSGQI